MKRICHMSSVHHGLDTRIFRKECVSLAKAGYETHLVTNASNDDIVEAARHGVTLHPLAAQQGGNRLARILFHARHCYDMARSLNADLYHFHDPELIPYGVLLARAGRKVIFDAHEDLPNDIYSKDWIPAPAQRVVAMLCRALQNFGATRFSAVVAATPYIRSTFEGVARRVVVINNYPLLGELAPPPDACATRRDSVCYVGGIDLIRGIRQVVQALSGAGVTLHLAGDFASQELQSGISTLSGWERVKYHGVLNRQGVTRILAQSLAGLVTFLPEPNHINAQPNKMFEYMSAGVPVIASDFPLWHDLIADAQCGICVDPNNPEAISAAIRHLRDHPDEVARMGNNGRQAVEKKYRWDCEEARLLTLYESIIGT
jgi:glycosyltransferase involved in cell wall biosynthesis